MAEFHAELLVAARRLLARRKGQRGPLPSAHIRRSISTSYYALFHFILDEVGRHVVGKSPNLRRRRRMLGRTIAHRSIKTTLAKVQGRLVHETVGDFLRLPGAQGSVAPPTFAQSLAKAFLDAQSKREEADYDLNKPFSENDARAV